MLRPLVVFAGGASALLVFACSGDNHAPAATTSADELSYVPFPSTVVLDATALGTLTAGDADGTLHFASNAGLVGKIAPGMIVVGGLSATSPKGLLRYVSDVTPAGAGVAVKTVDAPVQAAFRKLHVKGKRTLDSFVADGAKGTVGPRTTLHPLEHGTAGQTLAVDFLAFDGDNDPGTVDDQLHVTGSIGGKLDYDFGIDFDWDLQDVLPDLVKDCLVKLAKALIGEKPDCSLKGILPDVHAGLEVDASADASLTAAGVSYLNYSRTFNIAEATFDSIDIGPLVFVPTVHIDAKIEGGASSRFTVNLAAHAGAGAGVVASTKTGITVDPPHATANASSSHTDVVLGAKMKASVGPELEIKLYDAVGPKVGFKIYAELDADSQASPCSSTHLGLDGNIGLVAGIDFGVFGTLSIADYEKDFNLYDAVTSTGSCATPPAGQSKKAPGTGPDDATFAAPAFTPYAYSYAGSFGQYPYSARSGLGYVATTLSIDGRTLISGSHLEALTKVDNDGAIIWSEKLLSDSSLIEVSGRNSSYFQPQRTAIGADGSILAALDGYGYASIEQNGSLRWVKHVEGQLGTAFRRFTNVVGDGAGGFWLVGTRGDSDDDTRAWLLRIDAAGNVLSSQTWGPAGLQTYGTTILVVPDGVRVGSWTRSGKLAYISTFDANGTFKSVMGLNSSCAEDLAPTAVAPRADGGFVMVGTANDTFTESFFLTFDVNGNLGTQSSFAQVQISDCSPSLDSVVPLSSTGFVVAGTCFNSTAANDDALVLSLDAKGRPLWGATYGLLTMAPNGGVEGFASVRVTDDGGALFTAYADEGADTGNTRLLVAKTFAKDGKLTPKAGSPFTTSLRSFNGGSCAIGVGSSSVVPVAAPVTTTDLSPHVHTEALTATKTVYLP